MHSILHIKHDDDDDDVYLKKLQREGVTKSYPTQECRPAKGISKRVNKQIIKDTDITYTAVNLVGEKVHSSISF
jgi:hypothetical protein